MAKTFDAITFGLVVLVLIVGTGAALVLAYVAAEAIGGAQ